MSAWIRVNPDVDLIWEVDLIGPEPVVVTLCTLNYRTYRRVIKPGSANWQRAVKLARSRREDAT